MNSNHQIITDKYEMHEIVDCILFFEKDGNEEKYRSRADWLKKLIKDKGVENVSLLDKRILNVTSLAIESASKEMMRILDVSMNNLDIALEKLAEEVKNGER